jgi:hypothetical protein
MNYPLYRQADQTGRAVSDDGLQPLECWDLEFESRWEPWISVTVSVVCCQVLISARAETSSRGVLQCVL